MISYVNDLFKEDWFFYGFVMMCLFISLIVIGILEGE